MGFGLDPIGASGAASYNPGRDDVGSEGMPGQLEGTLGPGDFYVAPQEDSFLKDLIDFGTLSGISSLFNKYFAKPSPHYKLCKDQVQAELGYNPHSLYEFTFLSLFSSTPSVYYWSSPDDREQLRILYDVELASCLRTSPPSPGPKKD